MDRERTDDNDGSDERTDGQGMDDDDGTDDDGTDGQGTTKATTDTTRRTDGLTTYSAKVSNKALGPKL